MAFFTKNRFQILTGLLTEQVEGMEPSQENRRTIFVLVGPPSVGKSTWIRDAFEEEPYIINRDDIVNDVSSQMGWTYDDMFVTPPEGAVVGETDEKYGEVQKSPRWMSWSPTAFSKVMAANNQVQSLFGKRVSGASGSDKDIVVDMTNMNAGSRRGALKAAHGDNFKKVAVVFEFEGAEDFIQKVSQKRAEAALRMGKSKTIPSDVIQKMFRAFQRPDASEGFDEIVSVDNRELLRKLANSDEESVRESNSSMRQLEEVIYETVREQLEL